MGAIQTEAGEDIPERKNEIREIVRGPSDQDQAELEWVPRFVRRCTRRIPGALHSYFPLKLMHKDITLAPTWSGVSARAPNPSAPAANLDTFHRLVFAFLPLS